MPIRLAHPEDSTALLAIYGQYIHTPVTFEYDLPTQQTFAQRISSTLEDYPYLVWEDAGVPLGYAYAHREREREAYQWNAELSIYLAPSATGQGVGRRLYTALIQLLTLQGVHTVYGAVTDPNPPSEGLHQALGFRRLGVHQNTGYKNGNWHGVIWFEKALLPYGPEPTPVLPFPQLDESTVAEILHQYSI